jgi:DNA polymerase I
VHDAVLICAPLERLDAEIARMRTPMADASRIVLAGFELRTDAMPIRYPDRFQDARGTAMWERVMALINKRKLIKQEEEVA